MSAFIYTLFVHVVLMFNKLTEIDYTNSGVVLL